MYSTGVGRTPTLLVLHCCAEMLRRQYAALRTRTSTEQRRYRRVMLNARAGGRPHVEMAAGRHSRGTAASGDLPLCSSLFSLPVLLMLHQAPTSFFRCAIGSANERQEKLRRPPAGVLSHPAILVAVWRPFCVGVRNIRMEGDFRIAFWRLQIGANLSRSVGRRKHRRLKAAVITWRRISSAGCPPQSP
jgi:hypothetical protein